ncbi:50S ribosomal protein L9 [Candidatus Parcubacteria bacterium]|nr:50S ribosomal protein L9 [Candidatus Parcubacteria bacterium]
MKVVLLKQIKGLGDVGDVKKVKNGYADNFLLPNSLAKIANAQTIAEAKKQNTKNASVVKKALVSDKKIAEKIKGLKLKIKVKTNEQGKLYAAIDSRAVASELQKQNFLVKEKQVLLKKPIKTTGKHKILLKFAKKQVEIEVVLEKQ